MCLLRIESYVSASYVGKMTVAACVDFVLNTLCLLKIPPPSPNINYNYTMSYISHD